MVKAYWKRVFCRAAHDSAAILHIESKQRIMISALVILVVILSLLFWGSKDALFDEIIGRVASVVVLVALFPVVFLWKLVAVPAQIHDESLKEITDLHERDRRQNLTVDRISIVEFAELANSQHGWKFGNDSLESLDFVDALSQAGTDGVLEFEGRFGAASASEYMKTYYPLVPILREHLTIARFDIPMFFEGTENYNTGTCGNDLPTQLTYRDIHLNHKQAALKWLDEEAIKWRGLREAAENKVQEERSARVEWVKKDEARLHQLPSNIEPKTPL